VENNYGKDLSVVVYNVLSIIIMYSEIRILLWLISIKVIIIGCVLLTVVSFFLKMEDIYEDENASSESEKDS
jgi:hypothetical protein